MNLCFKYPIIFWNTACLTVNSGSLEDNSEEELVDIYEPEYQEILEGTTFTDLPDRSGKIKKTSSTDYGKLARAIGDTKKLGIKISLVDINKSAFGFKPDPANNQILYGMKGMLNVSNSTVDDIIAHRPYASPKDFLAKVKPNKSTMISLIKGGAFDSMMDRKLCMAWYIWGTCDKKKRITLQNMNSLINYKLLPTDSENQIMARRVYEFNRYLKAKCQGFDLDAYRLDERAINFLSELDLTEMIIDNGTPQMNKKAWDKIYQGWMDIFREWIAANKEQILSDLNEQIFLEDWKKYASGTISAWEMEVLCFYHHDHELADINFNKYGITNFFALNEEPAIEKVFKKGDKEILMYKLHKIAGTCIAKNKTKSTVTLLTTSGVVNVKFRKEYFSLFDKQISAYGADGAKHVIEKSWFNRGSMIMVTGIRRGDEFVAKKYASTGGHQLYKIDKIKSNGDLVLKDSRDGE